MQLCFTQTLFHWGGGSQKWVYFPNVQKTDDNWMFQNSVVLLKQFRCLIAFYLCSFLVEELSAKVEDGKDEIKTLKRKHVNNVKVSKNLISQCMEITVFFII